MQALENIVSSIQAPWLVLFLLGLGFLILKKLGRVSPKVANEMLTAGAVVIDVRGRAEYSAGHLPGSVNVPLGEIASTIHEVSPNKARPILVYCLSGSRSAMAKRVLAGHGYMQVANLGSLSRARVLLGAGKVG